MAVPDYFEGKETINILLTTLLHGLQLENDADRAIARRLVMHLFIERGFSVKSVCIKRHNGTWIYRVIALLPSKKEYWCEDEIDRVRREKLSIH